MVVYYPPFHSEYRVESSTLINAVQNNRDEVLKHIGCCPSDQTVFAVLGDFNIADVCWSSCYASSEYSMNILSAFDDLNLFQLVNLPTILSGKTPDLFWSNDPQQFVVYCSEKTYSDQYPIFAHLHVSGDNCFTPDVSKQMYSKKRFNWERFSCLLEPLYTKFYSNFQSHFPFTFLLKPHLMIHALKRLKEDLIFLYYASHSILLAKKLKTLRRNYISNMSYLTR